MQINNYIVAGCKPWNRRVFDETIRQLPGNWHFVGDKESLTLDFVRNVSPRYVFFMHWSWKVPEEILNEYECVCFHMTDVPYGRGGSPLQNLISRGHKDTKITALKMTTDFDAGPVYFKEPLCLCGNAEEIYIRSSYITASMIERIIKEEPKPVPQTGEPIIFNRRKPEESEIPELKSIEEVYDFLRMLDAECYPRAFITHRGFRYEFSRAALYDGRIVADVTITPLQKGESE